MKITMAFLSLMTTVSTVLAGPASADVDKALACSAGFTLARVCSVVDGPHDFNKFSLCMKQTEASGTIPEIHVVTATNSKVVNQDIGQFKDFANTADFEGGQTMKITFNGHKTATAVKNQKSYQRYSVVINANYAQNSAWTHKVYAESHAVTSTVNTVTGVTTNTDVALTVGDMNKSNHFLCRAP